MEPVIEIENLHKSFGEKVILKDVSLSVNKGETFVIIGMSGTGKTVVLRHIIGLLEPDSGTVTIEGVDFTHTSRAIRKQLINRMGYVFQSNALINWLTVYENVALPLVERRQLSESEITNKVNEMLKLLQLSDAKDKYPSDISGGMKKRVCLARVLVQNPDIILYDEPTTGLDPIMSNQVNDLVRSLQERFHVTSIVVTHDMVSAFSIADRIAVLYGGEIIQCDVPEKIKNSENMIVQQFIKGEITGPIKVD